MDNPNNFPDDPNESSVSTSDVLKMQQEHKEQIEALQKQNVEITSQFNQTLQSLASDRQHAQVIPEAPTITAEQIDEILESGQGGSKILDAMNGIVKKQFGKLMQDEINPLRQEGAAALMQMAQTQAESNPKMPFYSRFKKEIQEQLSVLQPAQRANPIAIKTAYDIAIGRNYETLMNESKEEFLRKQNDQTQSPGGTMRPGQNFKRGSENPGGTPASKTLQDDLSYEALEKVYEKGWDEEKYARASGFKSWDDLQAFKQDKTPNKVSYYKMLSERRAANVA